MVRNHQSFVSRGQLYTGYPFDLDWLFQTNWNKDGVNCASRKHQHSTSCQAGVQRAILRQAHVPRGSAEWRFSAHRLGHQDNQHAAAAGGSARRGAGPKGVGAAGGKLWALRLRLSWYKQRPHHRRVDQRSRGRRQAVPPRVVPGRRHGPPKEHSHRIQPLKSFPPFISEHPIWTLSLSLSFLLSFDSAFPFAVDVDLFSEISLCNGWIPTSNNQMTTNTFRIICKHLVNAQFSFTHFKPVFRLLLVSWGKFNTVFTLFHADCCWYGMCYQIVTVANNQFVVKFALLLFFSGSRRVCSKAGKS